MKRLLYVVVAVGLVALPASAWAHGERVSTFPSDGQVFDTAPPVVRLQFTEAPTKDSTFFVRDGCSRNVVVDRGGQDSRVVLRLGDGEPGQWFVSYNVISATDGHPTKGSYQFVVRGKTDCTQPDDVPSPDIGDAGEHLDPDDEPASFPVIPVVIGVVIVGGAIAVRLLSAR